MKIIESIISSISDDNEYEKKLTYKNMRKTNSISENNKLLGIRKLG